MADEPNPVTGPSRRPRAVAVALVALGLVAATLAAVGVPAASGAPASRSAPAGCTDPPPGGTHHLTPAEVRDHYGLTALHQAGHDGGGLTGAVIEFGQSVDVTTLSEWEACVGTSGPPVVTRALPGESVPVPPVVCGGGGQPACFSEAQGDAESMVTGAPGLDALYVIVSDRSEQHALADVLSGILDGSLTDGRRVDVVSLSFGSCMSDWSPSEIAPVEAGLQALARAGVWFFKATGDSGPSDCSHHPTCDASLKGPSMGYPASSPWLTSVGGTEFDDAGTPPVQVWNDRLLRPGAPDSCSAGGGGSSVFPTPAYQQQRLPGGAVLATRGLPDVAGLAGRPNYLDLESNGQWSGSGGTSMAAPLYAGAMASVRSALIAQGIAPPTVLNDALYALAAVPSTYTQVFDDVVTDDNDIYGIGCCSAGVGYDLASGLGEIDFGALTGALVSSSTTTSTTTPTTSTTATPGAPVTPSGAPLRFAG